MSPLPAAALCRCGAAKERAGHLACAACMAKVPAALRDRFFELSRTKRGGYSWHGAKRDVEQALAAIDKPTPVAGGAA